MIAIIISMQLWIAYIGHQSKDMWLTQHGSHCSKQKEVELHRP